MSLTYTPEDGTGLASASGYGTLAQIRAYNTQRGVSVSDDNDELIAQATLALDAIEAYGRRFAGARSFPLFQALCWPRIGFTLYGQRVGVSTLPSCVVNAHCYATGIVSSGVDLAPIIEGRAITKEVIGPLETDYSTAAGAFLRPIIPQLDAILAPILNTCGVLRVVRA